MSSVSFGGTEGGQSFSFEWGAVGRDPVAPLKPPWGTVQWTLNKNINFMINITVLNWQS